MRVRDALEIERMTDAEKWRISLDLHPIPASEDSTGMITAGGGGRVVEELLDTHTVGSREREVGGLRRTYPWPVFSTNTPLGSSCGK